jgi:hypothetical protein
MKAKIKVDPAIEQIREIRHQIPAEFGHDPEKVLAYYAELEGKLLRERGIHPDQKRSHVLRRV